MAFDTTRVANVATVVVALCAVLATFTLVTRPNGSTRARPASEVRPDSVVLGDWEKYASGGHSLGPADARLTIIEFGDYECPFCARFAREIDKLLAAYPNDIRFIYRHWPLDGHRFAYPAARAAECAAEQGMFWELHRLIYSKHDSLGLISFPTLASRIGIPDLSRFEACTQRSEVVDVIERGRRDATTAGGTGTPTTIVNGILLRRGVDSVYIASRLAKIGK